MGPYLKTLPKIKHISHYPFANLQRSKDSLNGYDWLELTLKAPRKKVHLKMLSAEVVCCKKLPSITDELSIEANSMDPEQTAPIHCLP